MLTPKHPRSSIRNMDYERTIKELLEILENHARCIGELQREIDYLQSQVYSR